MSDDYLWNKSGTPDAEIEQLERTLGSLRYRHSEKTRALLTEATRATVTPLIVQRRVARRFGLTPAMAVAAMLLITLIAGGLWLKMRAPQLIQTSNLQATASAPPEVAPTRSPAYPAIFPSASNGTTKANSRESAPEFARWHEQRHGALRHKPLNIDEHVALGSARYDSDALIAEGVRAKEQLVRALYIASEKLNFAQRRIQINKDGAPAS